MHKLFISYQRRDKKHAHTLAKQLGKHGKPLGYLHSRVDQDKRPEGKKAIRDLIKKRMKPSADVVLVLGPTTHHSAWVDYEMQVATSLQKPIAVIQIPDAGKIPPLPPSLPKDTNVYTWKEGIDWLHRRYA